MLARDSVAPGTHPGTGTQTHLSAAGNVTVSHMSSLMPSNLLPYNNQDSEDVKKPERAHPSFLGRGNKTTRELK